MPAEKWKANKFPEKDLAIVESLKKILSTVTCQNFILISTIDVYTTTTPNERLDEGSDLDTSLKNHHAYGKHRRLFEKFVETTFSRHLIVRLPALFGPYLKKNFIFDLLHDNNVDQINVHTKLQWYDLTQLLEHIQIAQRANLTTVNLFPEPVETDLLLHTGKKTLAISPPILKKVKPKSAEMGVFYNISTRFGATFGQKSDFA